MDKVYNVIIAHPGKQHSFQTAIAMEKKGFLKYYVTSVYNKKGSLTRFLERHVNGDLKKKLKNRCCNILPDYKVKQINELLVVITLFLNRFPLVQYFTENWNYLVESLFYKRLMPFVKKVNPDALIIYNGSSKKHLSILSKTNIVTFMDMSIAKREYIHDILQNEINETGLNEIKKMHMSYWDSKMIKSDIEGCNMVDYFLVPSNFVKKSLVDNGVPTNKIIKVPYGVDIDKFTFIPRIKTDDILKLIYVGNISYRKGSHRLLNVVSKLKGVELYLAGTYDDNSFLYKDYKEFKHIHFLGFVTRDKLNELYNMCDVFVLPSLCEGMAMVGLEAMATGLPLICTFNTGVNDVVEDGVNGFVYKANDNDRLREKIVWFRENQDKIPTMAQNARTTSLNYSWEIYYKNVVEAVLKCIKEKEIQK